eukprot:CAMPEP_0181122394 /NCGR_PEP_ID=MMETSP1071-20121207/25286_1 /TAXON_ID=35127 /ORGANISM="Thalassiosira sp., Strain NH16" /LENGTH=626 /DNA_ID=CAMNT_0023207353 /DNA_START=234 /DNA_END=2114 /DNA_ORIENTATION=+
MMMNRHRSTSRSRARESESRQPEEDGRLSRSARGAGANVPRSPRSSTSAPSSANANNAPTTPAGSSPHAPSTPHSAPPPSSFPKTRCYRLNLEKPFDIRNQKSPLGRDYSGPPVHDSDLPPAQGPVEYIAPPHLCSREEMAWRRHSWGGPSPPSGAGGTSTPSELMANLHVSISEESSNENVDATSIAITTARIFRGIIVDRSGVITSMNSRAMRSQRGKGGENKNKMGEKSRQAAKIDKAKDLIDDVENGGSAVGGASDEENDPTKIVSLFVMGEYEELNDLVRDGAKKLRDSKSLTDEAMLLYNRPRQLPPGMQTGPQPMALSPASSPTNVNYGNAPTSQYAGDPTMSPTSQSSVSSPASNMRKRVFSADKSRSRYKQVPRSAPPKLKSNPRDTRQSTGSSSGRSGRSVSGSTANGGSQAMGYHRGDSSVSRAQQQHASGGPFGCNPLSPRTVGSSKASSHQGQQQPQQQPHHYFPQQCNFFPGNHSDWTDALGFSVNSLWNCGANGGHLSPTMSPHSNPSSPRNSQRDVHQHAPTATGGGVYHGSGAPGGGGYHQSSGYHPQTSGGYHQSSGGYHGNSQSGGYHGGGNNYSASSPYRDEGRNPSYGYGRGGNGGAGVRDTVVM